MSIHVTVHGALNQDTFASSVSAVKDDEHTLDIDLRNCNFVDSYSVIELLIVMRRAERANWRILLTLPTRRRMSRYLSGMGLLELMPSSVEVRGSRPRARQPDGGQFLPVTPLDLAAGEFGIEQLCNFAYPNLPISLREEFLESLDEMGSNVVQHADAYFAFVSGQRA
jgi:hypothetical protein